MNSNISQEVNFSSNKLMQIVMDLISNPLKLTPEGVRVTANQYLGEEAFISNLNTSALGTRTGLTL